MSSHEKSMKFQPKSNHIFYIQRLCWEFVGKQNIAYSNDIEYQEQFYKDLKNFQGGKKNGKY